MGIILTGGKNNRLKGLTAIRSSSAIPIGGKYRAIDFTLSNMVNSGITNVGVMTQYCFRSLLDHLGSGKEWDLDRRYDGLFIFPPTFTDEYTDGYRGSADAMYHNITFLERSNEEYVVVAQGNCIYNMNFEEMIEQHIEKAADITIAYREMNDFMPDELCNMGILELSPSGRITDFFEKPKNPRTKNGSMGIYVLRRDLLISLLEESVSQGNYELVKDILINKVSSLAIYAYKFNGFWRNISTLKLYYRLNMELLNPVIRNELFYENGKIYTKVMDEGPAKYNKEAEVRNCIVGDGCIIEGTIENSLLFRGVIIKRGARIKNSIIMQGSVVEENAEIDFSILDKNVVLTHGKKLKGEANWPLIIEKGVVV